MNTEAPSAAEIRARMHDYWWLFVIDGLVLALLGAAIFFISIFSPERGIEIVDLIFGWLLIIWGGVSAVRVYYATQAGDPGIIWLAPIVIFILGLVLVIIGGAGLIKLTWIFGLILLVLGVLEFISGFSMDQDHAPFAVLSGILAIIIGVLILCFPADATLLVAILFGIGVFLRGLVFCWAGFLLRTPCVASISR